MKNLFISAMTLSFLGLVSSKISKGKCQTVELQENFDAQRYLGVWYELARDKTIPFEQGECNQATYSLNEDGTLAVLNTEYLEKSDSINRADAVAKCNGAKCTVDFGGMSPPGDYRVVSTDYESYAIVYSCTDLAGFMRFEYSWVLARNPELTQDELALVKSIYQERIPAYTFDNFHISNQDQATCKYFGEDIQLY